MPQIGQEQREVRDRQLAYQRRKNGTGDIVLLTMGHQEYEAELRHVVNQHSQAPAILIQDEAGAFPYLPGWDGPIGT